MGVRAEVLGPRPLLDLLPVSKKFETAKAALAALLQYREIGLQEIRMFERRAGAIMRLSESELRYLASRE
jgi:hypothetical protein